MNFWNRSKPKYKYKIGTANSEVWKLVADEITEGPVFTLFLVEGTVRLVLRTEDVKCIETLEPYDPA